MVVGDLRTAKFTLALHSSFKVSKERPGGLLLLEVDAIGSRLWPAPTNRLWLAVAEDAEPLAVAGNP